jgi:hypothetical protein
MFLCAIAAPANASSTEKENLGFLPLGTLFPDFSPFILITILAVPRSYGCEIMESCLLYKVLKFFVSSRI